LPPPLPPPLGDHVCDLSQSSNIKLPRRWEGGKRALQFTILCNIRGSWKTEILCRCPSRFGPPSEWTPPRSKSANEYGPMGGLYSLAGFGLPSRIWTPRIFYHCDVGFPIEPAPGDFRRL
jgi:hypothetical protein